MFGPILFICTKHLFIRHAVHKLPTFFGKTFYVIFVINSRLGFVVVHLFSTLTIVANTMYPMKVCRIQAHCQYSNEESKYVQHNSNRQMFIVLEKCLPKSTDFRIVTLFQCIFKFQIIQNLVTVQRDREFFKFDNYYIFIWQLSNSIVYFLQCYYIYCI